MPDRNWLRNWSTGEYKTYRWLMTKEWLLAKAHLLALLHTWDDELFEQCSKQLKEFVEFMDRILLD